jgi:small ligand-binding sensory domain FIST
MATAPLERTRTVFVAASASAGSDEEAVALCLDRLGEIPEGANLGFLYVNDLLGDQIEPIVEQLRRRTGVADWIGSVGIGICSSGTEHFGGPALAVLLAALPADSFRLFGPLSDGRTLDADIAAWVRRKHPMLGVVHADPRDAASAATIAELAAATGSFLVGGLASSRGRPYQLVGRPVEGGVSGVLLAPEVAVATGLTQGCSPIGPARRITRAQENIVIEIDGRPALDIFKEDIGELLARDLRRVAGLIFAAFPVRGSDTGDYLVRNLVAIDPANKVFAVAGEFAEGDAILFTRRDAPSAAQDLGRMLGDVKRRCAGETPRAGLYFSCIARGPNLFGQDSEELKMVRAELGDFPLAGFFANGEICNDRLYGYTGVLTVFL